MRIFEHILLMARQKSAGGLPPVKDFNTVSGKNMPKRRAQISIGTASYAQGIPPGLLKLRGSPFSKALFCGHLRAVTPRLILNYDTAYDNIYDNTYDNAYCKLKIIAPSIPSLKNKIPRQINYYLEYNSITSCSSISKSSSSL